jgi:peptide deformylase
MSIRKVAVMGNPILRQVAEPVPMDEIKSPKIQQLVQDMIETMLEYDGRGLAAPQIHESVQVVVLIWDFEPKKKPHLMCLINPTIKHVTKEESTYWEGCLSVPGMRGKVTRPNKLEVKSFDAKGEPQNFVAEGFAATVIQHECDHLMGKLYIDRMTDLTTLSFNKEADKFLTTEDDDPIRD